MKSIQGPEPSYDLFTSKETYNVFKHEEPFKMRYNKGILPQFQLAYETWGELNKEKDNAILIFTGLSATAHAKSNKVNFWECFYGIKTTLNINIYRLLFKE